MGTKIMSKKVFIIHGWTYTIKPWTSVISILKTRGIDPVQLKVPGLTQESDKIYEIKDYVNWLHQQIKDEKKPIIIAHSNGGRIALNYLNKFPGSFSKLILIGSAGVYDDHPRINIKKQTLQTLSRIFKPLAKISGVRKIVYKLLGAHDYNEAPENMKQTLKNMLESDKLLEVKDNGIKTVLIWGEKDDATPLWMGEKLHQQLPHSRLTTYKEWGHAPYITHPYELAEKITNEVKK